MTNDSIGQVREVLQRFQDGYTKRDVTDLDKFMTLFPPDDQAEVIGIGATEQFLSNEEIREIIESDWVYWGDMNLDVENARIRVHGEVAWLSTHGSITQVDTHDKAMPFYLEQMQALLADESVDVDTRIVEATHFGLRRWRERYFGKGFQFPLIFTAVLLKEGDEWRFHQVQWAMPVD